MSFNLHPQFTSAPNQHFANNMTEANQTTYAAPICTPTGHTFGQLQSSIPHTQFNQYPQQSINPFSNQTHYVFYHHYHHDYTWNSQQQQHQQQPAEQHQELSHHQQFSETVQQPQQQTWVPPDPFSIEQYQKVKSQAESEPKLESSIVDLITKYKRHDSPVQPKEQILEEIVRECEEIERRSSSGGSPLSSVWSSDERDTPDNISYRPYKTPERKERKKAQNRLAATRYREKKRREKEEAMECIDGLSTKNSSLKDQVYELEKEISYLKKLMTELGIEKKTI